MSMPKDFSEDGAAGASGPPQGTAGTFGNYSLAGSGQKMTDLQALQAFGPGALAPGAYSTDPSSSSMNMFANSGSVMFEDGGVVPDADDAGAGANPNGGDPTSGTGDPITLALTTVDNALAYGRKLNGLPDGGQQDAAAMPMIPGNQSQTPGPYKPGQPRPQQMAANMPMQPASQSESGVKPIQPMPGRLPPTSNPFGKRADNDQGDGDDSAPTIPTDDDEETA